MALISKMNRCAVCGSSTVVFNEESRTYHCASCGSDCAHTMSAADLALINRIAALGDLKGEIITVVPIASNWSTFLASRLSSGSRRERTTSIFSSRQMSRIVAR